MAVTAAFTLHNFNITVNVSNDTPWGTVTGSGSFAYGSTDTLTATVDEGYIFLGWNDLSTDNPRTIFPAQAIGLTAIFAIDQHTITVLSNDNTWGQVIGGGTYNYGTEIFIRADAITGYVFLSWNDGNTENPRYITVEQDSTFTAIFQLSDGINDANLSNVNVYSYENQVVVANAEGFSVDIFDMSGRLIISENSISQSVCKYTIATDGIYLVKVGNSVFKKVKIAR